MFAVILNSSVKLLAGTPPANVADFELAPKLPCVPKRAFAKLGPSVQEVPSHDSALAVAPGGARPPAAIADV